VKINTCYYNIPPSMTMVGWTVSNGVGLVNGIRNVFDFRLGW